MPYYQMGGTTVFYFCSLFNAAFSKPSSIIWCPGRPHQLWQQVFLAAILAWGTPPSVSIPCIHISAPNISYPVVIQGLPQFSHTNGQKKNLKSGQNPIPSTFFLVFIHQFVENSVLFCVQVSNPAPTKDSRSTYLYGLGLVLCSTR
jgi:hypothetical protein